MLYYEHMVFYGFIYALLTGLLPSLIWLWFWLREDKNPEPRPLLAALFVVGGLSVFAAWVAEQYVAAHVPNITSQYIWWAIIEEVLKFAVVAGIALHAESNDEPIDPMIYFITVALGFAALENTLFVLDPFLKGNVIAGLSTGNLRFLGATLVHAVSSASVGFMLGLSFYRSRISKFLAGIIGLAGACALHAAFNLSIINGGSADTLRAFAWIWGAVVIMIILFEEVKSVKRKKID